MVSKDTRVGDKTTNEHKDEVGSVGTSGRGRGCHLGQAHSRASGVASQELRLHRVLITPGAITHWACVGFVCQSFILP